VKVYIAAAATDVLRVQLWTRRLTEVGIDVVSTWVETILTVGEANPRDASIEQRFEWSASDLDQVDSAGLLWLLVPLPPSITRGAWLEFGYAHARGLELVSSGDTKQSIFCALGEEYATDKEAFVAICDREGGR
jgi:hypothetical protein